MKNTLALVLMVFGSFGAFADVREERLAAEKKAKLDCKDALEYNKCIKASYLDIGNANQDKYEIPKVFKPKVLTVKEERLAAQRKAEKKCIHLRNREDILKQDEYDKCFKHAYTGYKPLSNAEIWMASKKEYEANEKAEKKLKRDKAIEKYWNIRKQEAKDAREEAELQKKIKRAVENEMARCSPNC